MYEKLSNAIENIMNNINKSLNVKYFNKNVRAILDRINDIDNSTITEKAKKFYELFRRERINLWEIIREDIKIVYPIFIAYDTFSNVYKDSIESSIKIIEKEINKHNIYNEISASIFFIMLPVKEINKIKKEVIQCILQKKSII